MHMISTVYWCKFQMTFKLFFNDSFSLLLLWLTTVSIEAKDPDWIIPYSDFEYSIVSIIVVYNILYIYIYTKTWHLNSSIYYHKLHHTFQHVVTQFWFIFLCLSILKFDWLNKKTTDLFFNTYIRTSSFTSKPHTKRVLGN